MTSYIISNGSLEYWYWYHIWHYIHGYMIKHMISYMLLIPSIIWYDVMHLLYDINYDIISCIIQCWVSLTSIWWCGLVVKASGWQLSDRHLKPCLSVFMAVLSWCGLGFCFRTNDIIHWSQLWYHHALFGIIYDIIYDTSFHITWYEAIEYSYDIIGFSKMLISFLWYYGDGMIS